MREVDSDSEATTQALPRVELTPRPGSAAVELWRAVANPVANVRVVSAPERFRYCSESFNVDGLLFSRSTFDECEIVTHRDSRRSCEDLLFLQLNLQGDQRGQISDEPFVTMPEQVTLQDWSYDCRVRYSTVDLLVLQIPRVRLPAATCLSASRPTLSWSGDSTAGRLLAGSIRRAWQELPEMVRADAPFVSEAILGLVGGLIQATLASEMHHSLDAPLVQAMRLFIEERLPDPELSAEHIAVAFGSSRATVYRLFESDGGVQTYIRNRRLAQCYRSLLSNSSGRGVVEAVAKRWGFRSASQFRRVFKKRFGVSAGEVAGIRELTASKPALSGIDTAHAEGVRRLHSWAALA